MDEILPDDLPDCQAKRWRRAMTTVERLAAHKLLLRATLEFEGTQTRWAFECRPGADGALERGVPFPCGQPNGTYEVAVELALRPPVPLDAVVQLVVDHPTGTFYATDLVIDHGHCRSTILRAPLILTLLHTGEAT